MTCHSCASLIEDSLLIDGVGSVNVSFTEKTAEIFYNSALINSGMLARIIEKSEEGKYKATILNDSSKNGKSLNNAESVYIKLDNEERCVYKNR